MKRTETKLIKVGNITIGHKNDLIIQSMTTYKTSDIENNIKQILELEKLGCQLIRVSILDESDALSIPKIKSKIHIPLVADIHFSSKLALLSIQNGADKIRINPGNFPKSDLEEIIKEAKKYDIAIRIGVNYGSIDKELISLPPFLAMYTSVVNYIKLFESYDFRNLVLSVKCSDVNETLQATRMLSENTIYPIHIGVTEVGDELSAIVKSSYALGKLIDEGIGDTIRISINGDRSKEILTCKELLKTCGIRKLVPTLIACPTCGRCKIDTVSIVKEIREYLNTVNANITVAIMGCEVNGPGEASNADIGICGGNNSAILFSRGQIIRKVEYKDIIKVLKEEIEYLIS